MKALRDITPEDFAQRSGELDELTCKRAKHVITEDERTMKAIVAMQENDAVTMGKLMYASHESLRDDFEVSSDALNDMVEIAMEQEGCFGARMTGAGFGGCAVALVAEENAADFVEKTIALYTEKTGNDPAVYVCQATQGASVVSS